MLGGYSRKFSRRQCKFQLSRGNLRESKRSWRVHFQAFREFKIQNFGNHGATSAINWVYYKPPVQSYWEVGTYAVRTYCY